MVRYNVFHPKWPSSTRTSKYHGDINSIKLKNSNTRGSGMLPECNANILGQAPCRTRLSELDRPFPDNLVPWVSISLEKDRLATEYGFVKLRDGEVARLFKLEQGATSRSG